MKKLLLIAPLVLGLATPGVARAQVFGQYTPADVLPVNARLFGAYVDFSQDVVGLLGQLRLSFHPNVDFGFQGGLSRIDLGPTNKTILRLGGDVRFGAARASETLPVDVAVGGGLGVETSDDYSVLRLGPSAVASRAFRLSEQVAITPYAGAMLSFASVDVGSASETDFSVPLRLGAELHAMPGLQVTAEFQLRLGDDFNDHSAFSAGVNLPF